MTADPHPARFSSGILAVMDEMLSYGIRVLDPFAGTGLLHQLEQTLFGTRQVVTVELEEWPDRHPRTITADALALPFPDCCFGAIATSCCYGNRLADDHEARDGSRRITYRHALGRPLRPNNAGALQWGPRYWLFHRAAWIEATRTLQPDGLFILNCKDFIRKGEVIRVCDWHRATLIDLGYELVKREEVKTPGMGFGANRDLRVAHEEVMLFRRSR